MEDRELIIKKQKAELESLQKENKKLKSILEEKEKMLAEISKKYPDNK